jgi:hypothetical protein
MKDYPVIALKKVSARMLVMVERTREHRTLAVKLEVLKIPAD